MRNLITSIALMLAAAISNAQTTATNWTANDCSSVSHTLFTELNAGNIIVFVWVMPCGSCVNGAKAAYNAVQSFATSHPGKVRYYIADDLGDDNCTDLTTWITTNTIGATSNMTIFSNAGNVINEANFGGSGMPHVIVMGGTDHKIHYNKKGSLSNDQPGITAAINTALGALSTPAIATEKTVSVVPNPATGVITVSYASAVQQVSVTSVTGEIVRNVTFENGRMNPTVNISDLAPGVYFVKVMDNDGKTFVKEVTKQ